MFVAASRRASTRVARCSTSGFGSVRVLRPSAQAPPGLAIHLGAIARTRERIAGRLAPHASEVVYGVPLFLDQLRDRLQTNVESGPSEMGATASLHGGELLKIGLTIGHAFLRTMRTT